MTALLVRDVDVDTNGPVGDGGWLQTSCGAGGLGFTGVCTTSSKPHLAVVRWPSGRVEAFDFEPAPGNTTPFFLGAARVAMFSFAEPNGGQVPDDEESDAVRRTLEAFEGLLRAALPGLVLGDVATLGEGATIATFDSPTGDDHRKLVLWISGGEPSLAFGGWHTHGTVVATPEDPLGHRALIDIVLAIFDDLFVLVEESGDLDGRAVEDAFGLDLREPDAILEYQTDPYRLETARLLSWTGARDQPL